VRLGSVPDGLRQSRCGNAVKSLCRQTGKRFIPLRSASVTSLLAALHAPEVTELAEAAD
jgi:hypothetical protein